MKKVVVVVNDDKHYVSPLRHVITSDNFKDIETFKEWYYAKYHQLDGDRFYVFDNIRIATEFVKDMLRKENHYV